MMNSHGLSGKAMSYWVDSTPDTQYPPVRPGLSVDVAIIGGGFVGIMSALFLKAAGLTVAVLEGNRIVNGATGYTTAKVTSLHGLVYAGLTSKFGHERAKQYADSNQAAIEKIESLIKEKNIECDFSRLPFSVYATTDQALRDVEGEVTAAQNLGLPALFEPNVPLPLKTRGAVRFDNQAQFHPRKFLLKIAESIPGQGSYIFENSRVNELEEGKTCTLGVNQIKIQARHVIVATNFPVFDKPGLYFTRLFPKKSYVAGVRINTPFPHQMFIDAEESGLAWRAQPVNDGEIVVVTGGNQKAGHGDAREEYEKLGQQIHNAYSESSIEYSWATQDNITADNAPYIGQMNPLGKNIWVATGFAQWGMTTSVVAGMVLTDLLQGRSNPWAAVYNPSRFHIDKSTVQKIIFENTHNVETLVKGRLTKIPEISELANGEGKIVGVNGKRVAMYKDEQGQITRLNPGCKHLGCTVGWNHAEKSWDCPCHGSRYTCTGDVLFSPTTRPLDRIE